MTIDEMIAVLQAYKEGKTIQFAFKEDGKFVYTIPSEGEVAWDFTEYNYRIKPEPHYRPFESAEEVMEAINARGCWLKDNYGVCFSIMRFDDDRALMGGDNESFRYRDLYDNCTFYDGTPFGKLVED